MLLLASATLTIYVRSCFRVAELRGGFDGSLANNQVLFMVLEGAMVSYAAIILTIMHPGPVFKHFWKVHTAKESISNQEGGHSLKSRDGGERI